MVLKAAWEKDDGRDYVMTASLAKLYLGRGLAPRRQRGGADPRRLRLHGRVSGVAHVPRSEDQRDRRGHERSAALGDRTSDGPLMRCVRLTPRCAPASRPRPRSPRLAPGDAPAPLFKTQASLGGKDFSFDLARRSPKDRSCSISIPAAFTTGCTIEAHDFAEHIGDYQQARRDGDRRSGDDIATLDKFSRLRVPQQVRRRLGRQSRDLQIVRRGARAVPIRTRTAPRT